MYLVQWEYAKSMGLDSKDTEHIVNPQSKDFWFISHMYDNFCWEDTLLHCSSVCKHGSEMQKFHI